MTGAKHKSDLKITKDKKPRSHHVDISPLWVSSGVSVVKILQKIDRVITALYCIHLGLADVGFRYQCVSITKQSIMSLHQAPYPPGLILLALVDLETLKVKSFEAQTFNFIVITMKTKFGLCIYTRM